jgi:2-polyprenyl-6-methoxyphenol hydroxylase-like FAD-dependent oxidoreductase
MPALGERAVVLGASMGGLLAARVLADFFGAVTVIERDELPDDPINRRGYRRVGMFMLFCRAVLRPWMSSSPGF